MSKTQRLSVPLAVELERKLRRLSAENGRSLAANLAEIAAAGFEKSSIEREFAELKTALKSTQNSALFSPEIVAEMRAVLVEIMSEHARTLACSESQGRVAGGYLLPHKAAHLLFGEALFSAALSAQILNAELPGTPPKPAGFHIRAAREKVNVQLAELLHGLGASHE